MKKNLIFAALAAAALFAGCNKEMTEPVSPSAPKFGEQSFTAVREDFLSDETKAAFDGTSIGWQLSDSIIVTDGIDTSKFVVSAIDGKVATFNLKEGEKPLATSGVTYKAFYPCSIAYGKMPQQQQTANGEGADINHSQSIFVANPMYAESTDGTLEFKNLCGLLKINLSVPAEGNDIAFRQVILQTGDKPLYGSYTVADGKMQYTTDPDGAHGRAAAVNSNSKYVSVVKTYYFAIPEGSYENLEVIPYTNLALTQVFKMKAGKTLNIERNMAYTLNIYADNLAYYLPDPSRKGNGETANCYNVKQNTGMCCFPAIKGNSNEALSGVARVGILWKSQTQASAIDLSTKIITDVSYKDGNIFFKSVNNAGNAVIAAFDDSDNILWSWHIWSTSALVGTQTYPNGKEYMDRNLGAFLVDPFAAGDLNDGTGKFFNSVQSTGMLYQWGRKDPFTGRRDQSSGNTVVHGSEGVAETIVTSGAVNIATTIENPEKFYAPASTGIWCTEAPSWDGETKSLYDPCPPGYRVWANDAWGATPAKTDFSCESRKANAAGTIAMMGYNYLETAFYPTTGQKNNKNGTFGSGMTYFHSWHRTVVGGKVGFMELQHEGTAPNYSIKNARVQNSLDMNSAYGMSVRCEKIVE